MARRKSDNKQNENFLRRSTRVYSIYRDISGWHPRLFIRSEAGCRTGKLVCDAALTSQPANGRREDRMAATRPRARYWARWLDVRTAVVYDGHAASADSSASRRWWRREGLDSPTGRRPVR